MYKSYVDSVGIRGGVPVKWDDRMLEYFRERNVRGVRNLEPPRRECKDESKWRLLSWLSSEQASDIAR